MAGKYGVVYTSSGSPVEQTWLALLKPQLAPARPTRPSPESAPVKLGVALRVSEKLGGIALQGVAGV
ncbi:hypothetical protein CTA1_8034 [Colletotrichum tanaceti]|uniref:Uncharacterized protein n=1 Tax=Colletotrichum tanaceti TaxID=1306861 RepID=A0A4U6XMP9_9PEZI|nr:hypothetical protein CTA1_8034 [Colletotrichum tanaceti]